MTTNRITKPTNKVQNRVQIAFNPTTGLNSRIESLYAKYYGLSLTEIVKLAIIELDKASEPEDETAYIKKDKKLYARLLQANKKPKIVSSYTLEEFQKMTELD